MKGKKIKDALEQLRETIKTLENMNKDIHEVWLVITGITKMERKLFEKRGEYLFDKRSNKPIKLLRKYSVHVAIR